jgi:hypothetical protein
MLSRKGPWTRPWSQEVGTEEEGDEDGGCDMGLLSGFSLACLICE